VPELTPDELARMLAKIDEVVKQGQELSAQIKARMDDERRRDQIASDWSDRRRRAERRKRPRG
jgi:hypothetical protein